MSLGLPSCLIKKKKTSCCLGLSVWIVCFVDIVVSCDLSCELIFLSIVWFHLSIPLLMVNKVDQKSAFYANGYHSTLIYKYVNKLNYLST